MAATEEIEKEILAEMAANPVPYAAGQVNDVITIDGETRMISVPASEIFFGVESDKDVERKHFRCPKVVGDGIDLSKHQIYISYITSDSAGKTFSGNAGLYLCEDVATDGDDITFSWQLSGNVFASAGFIAFKVLAAKTDGENVQTRWNTVPAIGTVLMTVPDGMDIGEAYPDIVTQLLERMASVEKIATEEAMQGYVNTYLEAHPGEIDETLTDPKKAAPASVVGELKEDLSEQIGSQKFNGYYNLSKLENAIIYKGKRIAQYNVNTYEPVLVDDALYTTVIMPIDKTFGNYNMLIGENHPSSGIAMMRYKKDSVAAAVPYSQLNNLSWDADFDSSENTLSYLTNKIIESGSQVDTYAFCFCNTEPIVYPDIFPELNSGVLQLLKIIGKEQLTDDLQNTITNIFNSLSVDIMLPNEIYSVIGHEHNIYFWNTIKCSNIHDYTIRVSGANYGSGIKNLGDCVRMKPTAAKKQVIIFKVYKNDALLKEKSTTIKMIADNRPSARKVIFIGDSMVENGYEIAELKKMFGEDMIFYGTRQGGQKDSSDTWQTVYHEGRSSWDSGEYLNKASKNNVANAFYNPTTSKFDFSYYMNNNTSFNDVTDVFIQLGNNDADKMTKEQYVSNIQYIVDDIHKYNSNIKVFVCIPSPVVNDGYAYGTRNYVDVQYSKNHLFECGKHLMENIKNAVCVPIYQNLDCYNDFPKTEVAFSARNPDKHTVCNENVHPYKYGFYKFADTLYCAILGAYSG